MCVCVCVRVCIHINVIDTHCFVSLFLFSFAVMHVMKKKHVSFGHKIAGLLAANWHRNKWKAVIVTAKRLCFCMKSILNPFVNTEFINSAYSEKWSTLFVKFYKHKFKIPSNMHISNNMYNWSEKHQLLIIKNVGVIRTIGVPYIWAILCKKT